MIDREVMLPLLCLP